MRADNSQHIIAAARQPPTNARPRPYDAWTTPATPSASMRWHEKPESPVPGFTPSQKSAPRSNASEPATAHVHPFHRSPNRQRASDTSLLRRLDTATERIRVLEKENQQLRQALALALGEQRAATIQPSSRDTPKQKSSAITGPCS
jgi:hypothetical protein